MKRDRYSNDITENGISDRGAAPSAVEIFCSYAKADEAWWQKLETHLSLLKRLGLVSLWHDRLISPGTNWVESIDRHLETASVILLLISSDFFASDYCYSVEMQKALERHTAGTAHVIPVLLRPVDWHDAPFAHLCCLPSNTIPILSWTNPDEAFLNVVTGIRTTLETFYGLTSRQTHHSLPSRSREHRTRLIKQVRAFWINGVLEQSLHQRALITLGLHEQPNAIANPWHLVMQEAERPPYPLLAGTRISDVYNDSDGTLLILGKPGAGKTTLLLELARDLLTHAEQDREHPIPVVFHLSSWAKQETSLALWLVKELHNKYQISHKIGQAWIDTDNVLLLLDGLDEITPEAQLSCIQAINSYHQEHNLVSIVLCSRSTEYFAQTTQVTLQKAVEIQSLTASQVDEYLLSAGKQLEALRFVLSKDSVLRELSTTPLMLNIMSLAYSGKDVKDIVVENSTEKRWNASFPVLTAQSREVFKTYVQQMLHRRGSSKHFDAQQIIHWLTWTAKNSGGDIYAAQFQHPARAQFFSDLAPLILSEIPTIGILLACFGIATQNLLSSILLFCLEMVPFGLIIRASLRYITSGGDPSKIGASYATITYSTISLVGIYMLFALFFQQRWVIILLGIVAILGCYVLLGLLIILLDLLSRVRLYLSGDIPWDYNSFLDYATEHILLYKVGEKYIFIHNLLYSYFRSLDATSPKKKFRRRTVDEL